MAIARQAGTPPSDAGGIVSRGAPRRPAAISREDAAPVTTGASPSGGGALRVAADAGTFGIALAQLATFAGSTGTSIAGAWVNASSSLSVASHHNVACTAAGSPRIVRHTSHTRTTTTAPCAEAAN